MATDNSETSVPYSAKLAVIIACVFWAASFIATKTALDVVPPLTVVMLRMIISALCFVPYLIIRRGFRNLKLSWMPRLFIMSLFGTGLHYSLQTIGINYTTASNASLYAVTPPITITIIAAIFLGERITLKKGFGILIALVGVLVVMGIQTLRTFELKGHLLGDLLVFASLFMWGIFTVLSKDMTHKINAIELTGIVTIMGALYMIPVGIIEMNHHAFSIATLTLKEWTSIGFLGITCSFLATLLYVFALQKTESQKVGVYLYTIPPMTYIIAFLYLKENIGINLIFGSIIVLIGVYLTERG